VRPENRLRARADFERVTGQGGRVAVPEFVLYHFARETPPDPRVGLAVGRRIGGAVVRNRVRRRLREAIRPLIPRLAACDVVVVARPPAVRSGVTELGTALEAAAARAGLLPN
jgi:ribonuclease P protein component